MADPEQGPAETNGQSPLESTEPSSVRLAGTLAVAGLVSGLILVGVYLGTKPLIQENRAEALRQAIYKVLPGTEKIEPFAVKGDGLVAFQGAVGAPTKEQVVYRGVDANGKAVGFAIPAEGAGFQDAITLIYGYDPSNKTVIGMEVLESRETPGLGDKIAFDPAFKKNFEALEVEPEIVLVKKGEKTKPNQVDAITGATISSRAVVKILRESTTHFVPIVDKGVGEKTAKAATD